MLSQLVTVLLAASALATATPGADGGFIPALSFLTIAVMAAHFSRGLRACPAITTLTIRQGMV